MSEIGSYEDDDNFIACRRFISELKALLDERADFFTVDQLRYFCKFSATCLFPR